MSKKKFCWATHCHTYKLLNFGVPEELARVMPRNTKGLRMTAQNKLDTKPKWLSRNKGTRSSYRNRANIFNTLQKVVTAQEKYKDFKKELKKYFLTKMKKVPCQVFLFLFQKETTYLLNFYCQPVSCLLSRTKVIQCFLQTIKDQCS